MMTQATVNLVPAEYLGRARRRRCIHRWTAASVGVIAAASIAVVSIRIDDHSAGQRLESQLAELSAAAAAIETAMPLLENAFNDANAQAQVQRRLDSRPDWGVMLAILDSARPAGLVFETTAIAPTEVQPGAMPDRLGPVRLTIRGLAGEQKGVLDFVGSLERTGMFDDVQLVSTSRRVVGNLERVEFHLVGVIGGVRVAEVNTP